MLGQDWERQWDEQNLPEDFREVLDLLGQALHDTVKFPAVAENFYGLPEQIFQYVKALDTKS